MNKNLKFLGVSFLILITTSTNLFAWNFHKKSDYLDNTSSNNKSYKNKKTNNISFEIIKKRMEILQKLAYKQKIENMKLQIKNIDTKINILNKTINTLTTIKEGDLVNSINNYAVSPKIIVKTIDYDVVIKKPLYKGLLIYYNSKSLLGKKGINEPNFSSGKILSAVPLKFN